MPVAKKSIQEVETLREWLNRHNVNKDEQLSEFKNLFYSLDLEMKQLHESGFCITSFHVHDILISGHFVKYKKIRNLYYEDREELIRKNIFYLSCLAIGIYDDCLGYINPENPRDLKDNFSSFATFLPEDVVPYYKGIIERDATVYLSDYMKAKVEKERAKEQKILDSVSNTSAPNKGSYSKSTLIGRLYADENSSNMAAFVQIVLFPVIILLLAILIPIMIILNH